ncbi:MAG TPA: hypothetical protein ENJ82_01560 [Bacteroidetes bacterium]|nr:hypothetical protein [Bacteroidota bacterium]
METFNIEVNIQEANTILQALGQLPFAQVHGLIHSIQEQATAQMNGETKLQTAPNAEVEVSREPVTV